MYCSIPPRPGGALSAISRMPTFATFPKQGISFPDRPPRSSSFCARAWFRLLDDLRHNHQNQRAACAVDAGFAHHRFLAFANIRVRKDPGKYLRVIRRYAVLAGGGDTRYAKT